MPVLRFFLSLLIAALCSAASPGWQAAAQNVAVVARANATTIGAEEVVTYTLEVEGVSPEHIQSPQAPLTTGLVLLQSTPTTRHETTRQNGSRRERSTFQWQFRPVREGTARIRPARVTVRGETHVTGDVQLRVVPQAQQPPRLAPNASARDSSRGDEGTDSSEDDGFFIEAVPSARSVYQNEQLTLTYRLYFPEDTHLQGSRLADTWDAAGFWREELDVPDLPVPSTIRRDGQRYHTIALKRVAVFPTRSGRLHIDPLRIETHAVAFRRGPYSGRRPFGMHRQVERLELASDSIAIDVAPLPEDAPDAFAGAVGQYQMQTELSSRRTEVGRPLRLRVHITGRGNIAMVEAPTLEVPVDFEVYDPSSSTALNRRGAQLRGTKTFSYTIVPHAGGTYTLPAVAFAYFDPEAERYETLRSSPQTISVSGVDEAPPAAGLTGEGLPVDDIAGVMTHASGWRRIDAPPFYRNFWIYLALLVPALVVAGLLVYRHHRTRLATDRSYARSRRAHPVARQHLERADELRRADQPRLFYEEVERALLSFIGNRLDLAVQGLTRPQLETHLAGAGVSAGTRRSIQRLLDECDRARFAPAPLRQEDLQAAQTRAEGLIADLDRAFS